MSDCTCDCPRRYTTDPRLTPEALSDYATARESGGRGDRPTVVAAMAMELIRLRAWLEGGRGVRSAQDNHDANRDRAEDRWAARIKELEGRALRAEAVLRGEL